MRFTSGFLALMGLLLAGCADTGSVAPSGAPNQAPLQDPVVRAGARDIAVVNRCGAQGEESHKLAGARQALREMATRGIFNTRAGFEAAYREEFANVQAEPMPSMEMCRSAAARVASLTGTPVVEVTGSPPKTELTGLARPKTEYEQLYDSASALARKSGDIAGSASLCGVSEYRLDRYRERITTSVARNLNPSESGQVGVTFGEAFAAARTKPLKDRLTCAQARKVFDFAEAASQGL